jgi:hypothetical protein
MAEAHERLPEAVAPAEQVTDSLPTAWAGPLGPALFTPDHVLALQRTAGNASVCRYLARSPGLLRSPLSDELSGMWTAGDKATFFERLRNLGQSDPDLWTWAESNLTGDDLWLARNVQQHGPEPQWPIQLRVEREMKTWGGGKGAVFELLRAANGSEAGNPALSTTLARIFARGSDDLWLAEHLQQHGRETQWPMRLRVEREMKSFGDVNNVASLLSGDPALASTITALEAAGLLGQLINRVSTPANRRQLLRALGSAPAAARGVIEPHVAALSAEWQVIYNLATQGVSGAGAPFTPTAAHTALIGGPTDPFSGVGATGTNPSTLSIPAGDQAALAWEEATGSPGATTAAYSNPVGSLPGYLAGLTATQRTGQAELFANQQISSTMASAYGGALPSRRQVITAAAAAHNLEPALVAGFLLAEQRDQSRNEDAKDFLAATSMMTANTSIGLGQIVISTARRNDLFADLLAPGTRSALSHEQIAQMLASDEMNIFAAARYLRRTATDGATKTAAMLPGTAATYPAINFALYAGHSSTWPADNIRALGSEYTSRAWDDVLVPAWGDFVYEAYLDCRSAGL